MSFQRLTQALTCCTLGQSINEYVMYMHAYSHTRKPSLRWPLGFEKCLFISNSPRKGSPPNWQGKMLHYSLKVCSHFELLRWI